MRKYSKYSKHLLYYASYEVINSYKEKKKRLPTGLYFNKIMSLLNQKLKRKGVEIGLPHYWYRYGDQVHRYSMPSNLIWDHEEPTLTIVGWRDTEILKDTEWPYNLIGDIIKELTEKYADNEYEAVHEVYRYAPFSFQQKFLGVREILHGRANAFNWDNESYNRISEKIILDAMKSFPKRHFPQLDNFYQVVYNFIEELMERDEYAFKLIEKICINFWFLFCYYLRLHKKAHENIPPESLAHWQNSLELQRLRYRKIFGDFLIEAKDRYPDILKNHILKEEYNWRIEDIKTTRHFIDVFVKEFETSDSQNLKW